MQKRIDFLSVFAGLAAAAALVVALYFQFRYAINPDNAVLVEFARRILAGGVPVRDYYDTNPPLSALVYIPAVLLSQLTSVPLYHAITIYTLFLCLMSASLCYAILRRIPSLDKNEAFAFSTLYLLGNFYISHIFFGERDQIVMLGLIPLVLAQFALNENIKLPPVLLFTSLLFGSVSVLIKPHYGLLPAAMMAWRLSYTQPWRALLRPDFFVLAATTALYIAAALILFRPYFDIVAPDVLLFYAPGQAAQVMNVRVLACLFAAAGLGLAAARLDGHKRGLCFVLAAADLCLLVAYLAQSKGYYYHLVPAQIIALCSVGMTGTIMAPSRWVKAAIVIAAVAFLVAVFPVKAGYPTHEQYAQLPVGKILDECPSPCRFFMFNDYNYMIHETALYKNAFHASRFPVFWFEPPISCGFYDELREKYESMVTEDFARWQPSLVLLYKGEDICPDGGKQPFDFVDFFSRDPAFAQEWQNYAFDKTVTFNRRDYFRGTSADEDHMMTFDIYRRKSP